MDGFLRLTSGEVYLSEVEEIDFVQAISSQIELVELNEFDGSDLPSPLWSGLEWAVDDWKVLAPEKARDRALLYLPIDGSLKLPIMDELFVASSDILDVVSMCWKIKRESLDVPLSPLNAPFLDSPKEKKEGGCDKNKLIPQRRAEALEKVLIRLEEKYGEDRVEICKKREYSSRALIDLCKEEDPGAFRATVHSVLKNFWYKKVRWEVLPEGDG
ncbi:MAG: hypothetical protein RPU59_07735 [Candidatus Sedimenticola sp. (ex Thyasira tokunagai)]